MEKQFYDEDMARQQEKLAATSDMVTQRRFMLNQLRLKEGERVLDIGSGNGILAREMLEVVGESGHVCGVDSAEPMVSMATALCPNGQFLQGDATALPVEDSSFDVVTASQLLCFVSAADMALSEMFRALKPGGRLVILESDWGSLVWNCSDRSLMDRVFRLMTGVYADAHVPRTLSRRLTAAGFQITSRRSFSVINWEPGKNTYAKQLLGFIRQMMEASDDFTKDDWEAWSEDQKATAEAGEFMFSVNRYIFSAVKPNSL
jgi:ubiquinone/menaquinone biosynthesis C-methylase UbiE